MTISKASLSKLQYTTPIADFPNPPTIDSTTDVGTSRAFNDGAASMKSLTENSEEVLHGKELDEKIL